MYDFTPVLEPGKTYRFTMYANDLTRFNIPDDPDNEYTMDVNASRFSILIGASSDVPEGFINIHSIHGDNEIFDTHTKSNTNGTGSYGTITCDVTWASWMYETPRLYAWNHLIFGRMQTLSIKEVIDEVVTEEELDEQPEVFTTVLLDHTDDDYWGVMSSKNISHIRIPISLIQDNNQNYLHYWIEDYSIFTNHVDCWNCSVYLSSDNDDIQNNYEIPYSGTGDDIDPFNFWYIKIGSEWMQVVGCTTSRYTVAQNVAATDLVITRGVFDTDITSHSAGETVEIWTSLPEGFTP